MEPEYSKREIDTFMDEIKSSLTRIETQTTKTNGSVAGINKWRQQVNGGLKVFVVLMLPILTWALIQVVGIDKKIKDGVEGLSANVVAQ